jgi:hypothetical protein
VTDIDIEVSFVEKILKVNMSEYIYGTHSRLKYYIIQMAKGYRNKKIYKEVP